jgi:hypothetical protein
LVSVSVSQIEFATMMGVTRQTVNTWKREGRIVMIGKSVAVGESRARLLRYSTAGSKALTGAQQLSISATDRRGAVYDPPQDFGNPANLPGAAIDAAVAIEDGAATMARIIGPHLPMPLVRELVAEWTECQRGSYVGGPDLPEPIAVCDDWPIPLGYQGWREHPLFADPPITEAEWVSIEVELAASLRLPPSGGADR